MKDGYCYLHSDDDLSSFDFPEKADKTKNSLLISIELRITDMKTKK